MLRENQYEKNIIFLIYKDNITKKFLRYQTNAIIININDYHNIYGLQMPTTTSISTITHITTILAILISITSAILKNIVYNMNNINMNQYYIYNLLFIDSNFLIF